MTAEEPEGYDLVMPFVSVASKGGPYDDDAYAAGWAMGALDARLGGHPHVRPLMHEETVRTADVEQADLIAMKNGYRMSRTESEVEEWVFCRFDVMNLDVGGGP
jgi:hypothetical protein